MKLVKVQEFHTVSELTDSTLDGAGFSLVFMDAAMKLIKESVEVDSPFRLDWERTEVGVEQPGFTAAGLTPHIEAPELGPSPPGREQILTESEKPVPYEDLSIV